MRRIIGISFTLSMVLLASSSELAVAQETSPIASEKRSVAIDGEAELAFTPDQAIISLVITNKGDSANEAITANIEALDNTLNIIKKYDIKNEDIKISNYNLETKSGTESKSMFSGESDDIDNIEKYTTRNFLTVTTKNIKIIGEMIDNFDKKSINSINVQFQPSNLAELVDQGQKEALKNAMHKAGVFASAANLRLGKLISLDDTTGSTSRLIEQTNFTYTSKKSGYASEAGSPNVLRVTISARFELENFQSP